MSPDSLLTVPLLENGIKHRSPTRCLKVKLVPRGIVYPFNDGDVQVYWYHYGTEVVFDDPEANRS
jgi:hypothetical protein